VGGVLGGKEESQGYQNPSTPSNQSYTQKAKQNLRLIRNGRED
jgi:hypothetical protein